MTLSTNDSLRPLSISHGPGSPAQRDIKSTDAALAGVIVKAIHFRELRFGVQ
jgi:hypothetical protein